MAKPTIITRTGKGSPLTYAEGDANLTNLKDATISIKAGSAGTTVSSDLNGQITLVAGSNITLTGDDTAKTITLAASGATNLDSLSDVVLGGTLYQYECLQYNGTNWVNATPAKGYIGNDTTTATAIYPLMGNAVNNASNFYASNTKLSFIPSTGVLSATGFSGPLSGTATNATNIGITNDTATATEQYLTFVAANTGNNAAKVSSTKLRYFPSTGALFATSFNGAFNSDSFSITSGVGGSNWTTAGLGFKASALAYNENTATGTKASAYVHSLQTPTLTSTNVLTITDAATLYLADVAAGTNSTLTNKYSLITAGAIKVGGKIVLKELVETVYALTYAATLTPAAANGSVQKVTLTGNVTISAFTNPVAGQSITLILTQDATGSRILTSTFKFSNGSKTLSTAANAIDVLYVFYDGTNYLASLVKGFV